MYTWRPLIVACTRITSPPSNWSPVSFPSVSCNSLRTSLLYSPSQTQRIPFERSRLRICSSRYSIPFTVTVLQIWAGLLFFLLEFRRLILFLSLVVGEFGNFNTRCCCLEIRRYGMLDSCSNLDFCFVDFTKLSCNFWSEGLSPVIFRWNFVLVVYDGIALFRYLESFDFSGRYCSEATGLDLTIKLLFSVH